MKDVVRDGYVFNRPVLIADKPLAISPAPDFGDLVLETVKPAEDGSGTIYRVYERYGKETPLPAFAAEWTETDLEERPLGKPHPTVGPHGIVTLLRPKTSVEA